MTEPERTIRLTGNPREIDLTIDLQHLDVEHYTSGVRAINTLRDLLDDQWREVAYANGESSRDADWQMALSGTLPDDVEPNPWAVAAYIRAEQQRLR